MSTVPHITELTGSRTWNELETARQGERDRAVLGLGILAVAAIVVGMLLLLWLGGPRVEDPLPTCHSEIRNGVVVINDPPAPNGCSGVASYGGHND